MVLIPMIMSLALHFFQRHHFCSSFGVVRSSTREGKKLLFVSSSSWARKKSTTSLCMEETKTPTSESPLTSQASPLRVLDKSNFYSVADDELETLLIGNI